MHHSHLCAVLIDCKTADVDEAIHFCRMQRRGLGGAVFGCDSDLTRAAYGRFYNHINGIGAQ